jgi:hypothetical protein
MLRPFPWLYSASYALLLFYCSTAAVNDAPSFAVAAADRTITVVEDSTTYVQNNWATAVSAGPGETDNGLVFAVSCSSSANFTMFTAPLRLTNAGMLSFTPAANAFGTTVCNVTLVDSGGLRSATEQLTVIITPGKNMQRHIIKCSC